MNVAYEQRVVGSSQPLYNRSRPVMSPTSILEATHAPSFTPAATPKHQDSSHNGFSVFSETLQRLPSPSITLPALACLLMTLNHVGAVIRFLWSLGIIDGIAIICIMVTAILVAQHLQVFLRKAAQNLVVQVLDMTDSRVMLAKLTEIATLNPAPSRWLNMYYTMVDDIAGLHQENIKMRTIMSGMQADIEHLKAKGKYIHPVRTMYRAVAGDKKSQTEVSH